ncbi:LIM-type zinc finger-containing protein [Histomonas meleagridis]|uniref:LIM-type zinc finger-containing protein n=1 Tax=Histomonas meleagridis TaxID=135588 RepID=UPI00355A33BF|nr:LIM-type zinc finger-containing protein [Histomonas meleagridis]KAH0804938.1 LIM-type zinc finger-containing protein [Histomonas meleagridis]
MTEHEVAFFSSRKKKNHQAEPRLLPFGVPRPQDSSQPFNSLMDEEDEEVIRIIRSGSFDSMNQPVDSQSCNDVWASIASFGPRCNRCGNPCGDDVVYHGSLAFHRRHFTCKQCGVPIQIPTCINGEIYCKECAKNIKPLSHRCFVCNAPRNPLSIVAAGKCFCPNHFLCALCGCKLNQNTYIQRGGQFYCREHAPIAPQFPICDKCHKEIREKRVINAFRKNFHPACFSCSMCNQNLADQKYISGYHEKPICVHCFKSLPKEEQALVANNFRAV